MYIYIFIYFIFWPRSPISADKSINFLAHISLEEYGPCLQVKGDSQESQKELENVTDGFSVSAIKVTIFKKSILKKLPRIPVY